MCGAIFCGNAWEKHENKTYQCQREEGQGKPFPGAVWNDQANRHCTHTEQYVKKAAPKVERITWDVTRTLGDQAFCDLITLKHRNTCNHGQAEKREHNCNAGEEKVHPTEHDNRIMN